MTKEAKVELTNLLSSKRETNTDIKVFLKWVDEMEEITSVRKLLKGLTCTKSRVY